MRTSGRIKTNRGDRINRYDRESYLRRAPFLGGGVAELAALRSARDVRLCAEPTTDSGVLDRSCGTLQLPCIR